jgi:hypothetical protein
MACRCQGQHDFTCMGKSHQIVRFVAKGSNDDPPPIFHPAPPSSNPRQEGGGVVGKQTRKIHGIYNKVQG